MKTTIAELDIEAHVRWAKDQDYDTKYITESHLVAPHPEILGVSSIYASKFEELFELQRRNMPWAAFAPPKNFHLFSKRFFSYRLFYGFKPFVDEEEEGEKSASSLEEILNVQPQKHLSKHAFEKEKTAISDLLKSIHWINHLLGFVSSRKLQFQKG
ncbi:MAG: DUF5399 family protein [Verrucomicrobia bacterium]|nr:DUF5399 family protein [Verrucomicrobiota bacterium]